MAKFLGNLAYASPFIITLALLLAGLHHVDQVQAACHACTTDSQCAALCGGNGDPEPK